MGDRQLYLWMNERWYNALAEHLGGEEKLQQRLEDMADDLINILPDHVCAQVSREIQEEQRQWEAEAEANRRFAVFQVTEHGGTAWFLTDWGLDALSAARDLRNHLLSKSGQAESFADSFSGRTELTPEQFNGYIRERLEGGKRVTGVFRIDLDAGTFATMDRGTLWKREERDCWHSYQTRDVSAAAYRAFRAEWMDWSNRLDLFNERLSGRELTPGHALDISRITFSDEIVEMEDRLNFYVAVDFDPDLALGTHVCTDENDDWINVYANYDTRRRQVSDELEVVLCRGNGTEQEYIYPLTSAERKALTTKMDAFCQEQTGLSLKEYGAQLREQNQADGPDMADGPVMG